jgi:cell wall-associated NlpC family hydrolase
MRRSSPVVGLACVAVLLAGACASSRTAPRSLPAPGAPVNTSTLPPFPRGIVETALALAGTPYQPGGSGPKAFDCSGYVMYVFGTQGVRLPRTVAGLFLAASPVRPDRVAAGDLVFFDTSGGGASHVGIALGDGRFIHAPSSRGVVRVESLASEYWKQHYLGARRVRAPAGDRGTKGKH